MIDAQMLSYATVRQIEYLEAVDKYGSQNKAAKALGIHRSVIDRSIKALKAKTAQRSATQHQDVNAIPAGFAITGTSTLSKTADGLQWVKTSADKDKQADILREFAESLAEGVKGLAPITKAPKHTHDDLLCVYPIGDPHFGLRVCAEEGGAPFNLETAERLTCQAIDRLIASAPAAQTAVLLNLGDHFHTDSQKNATTSGTSVDVDGRWAKIQQVGLRAMLYCVNRLLEKHEKVIFRLNRGNHDKDSSYALSLMVSCYFHNEPRVHVDISPKAFWYYQFGQVLLASTHGDTTKGQNLMGVMAADKPQLWGASKHRYWYVGHIHHVDVKEYPGGIVEHFRTLAAGDAWHDGQGYRSGRDMRLIVMHKEHGEIERHRVDVGMLA